MGAETELVQTHPHPVALHVISRPQPLRDALLTWYDQVHALRGMPWRKPYNHAWDIEQKAQRAYEVWVSEIMLQQTQVATVIPYYNKWMDRFPTIRDLAASDIDTVNGLWKGLGYYSRAARLLNGAKKAVEEFDGRLPDNAKDMENKVPGIGRYSAGAICSIAYNERVPVLDGNVHRLLSRVLALHAPPKAKQTLDVLWAGASAFVPDADRPGDVNQALIELGSTVCKVREPSCGVCPLQQWCAAYERQEAHGQGKEDEGTNYATSNSGNQRQNVSDIEELCTLCEPLPVGSRVSAYPMKAEKKKAREELDIVNVIEWRKNASGARWFLLVRRPEGGLLAGLHEFPTAQNVPVTTSPTAQITIADTLLSALLACPPPTRSSRSAAPSDSSSQASRRRPAKPSPGTRDVPHAGGHGLQVVKIVPAGDVLHVFSHIRKTYRVQWVLLEGGADGSEPPSLVERPDLAFEELAAAKPKTVKGKSSRKDGSTSSEKARGTSPTSPPQGQTTQWVPLDAVADANIGTGVVKIWRQVRALWADGEKDEVADDNGHDA
ncbi:DNA glycosylase [Lentinus tigrinus ALCF2SS1-7]|uniref:Adenine DNA glycosylase n=1 Tax=Lentinus tigrinus ALCF2SS1-6 TaxID=1328759 RepID=A0A5C2SRM0_9APHY|nr:DNA glycosylase [Lentinus tigrinus ALCF2SS1-6]RPD78866.1 DNA glycosylase [Lentinus tigrinus ALCF2SS1-7]